jgi:hypothetical protein
MHDTTPFASFLPLNGFIMVLDSVEGAGDEFPNNLRNKPMFAVNGGKILFTPRASSRRTSST